MEFKIENTQVYGLENAIRASGNPMRTKIVQPDEELTEKDYKRAERLANTGLGEGHDQWLTGCIVQFDIYAPMYMWPQVQRYNWIDPVNTVDFQFLSSQSKMHCITKFDIKTQCTEYVWPQTIRRLNILIKKYNEKADKEVWKEIIANIPSGFILGATLVTNYRQLKTMYSQRKNHRLDEWKEFCKWVESLPHSEFITGVKK